MSQDLKCIGTYPDTMQAEVARMTLEAKGIRALVATDDCGGMRPHLQTITGIRLLVRPDQAAEAAAILSPATAPE